MTQAECTSYLSPLAYLVGLRHEFRVHRNGEESVNQARMFGKTLSLMALTVTASTPLLVI
jgi:hypothetical protein